MGGRARRRRRLKHQHLPGKLGASAGAASSISTSRASPPPPHLASAPTLLPPSLSEKVALLPPKKENVVPTSAHEPHLRRSVLQADTGGTSDWQCVNGGVDGVHVGEGCEWKVWEENFINMEDGSRMCRRTEWPIVVPLVVQLTADPACRATDLAPAADANDDEHLCLLPQGSQRRLVLPKGQTKLC